jgi:hypothetical protein
MGRTTGRLTPNNPPEQSGERRIIMTIKDEYQKVLTENAGSDYEKEQILKAALLPLMEVFGMDSIIIDDIVYDDIDALRDDVENDDYKF